MINSESRELKQIVRGNIPPNATLKKSIKALPQPCKKIESSFTFCNACVNSKKLRDKLLSRYVALGNFCCDLCLNKVAR